MTWAGLVGICTALGAALAYVTSALPHGFAGDLTYAGVALAGIDRFATMMENRAVVKKG